MNIYVVSWTIITTFQVPCPDQAKPNEFGIKSVISCGALHSDTKKENKERLFFDKDSAYSFYDRAKSQESKYVFCLGSHISNVSIDSIETNK